MATIKELLKCAEINLRQGVFFIGTEQLHIANTLLDKGYSLWDDVDGVLEDGQRPEDAPEKEKD